MNVDEIYYILNEVRNTGNRSKLITLLLNKNYERALSIIPWEKWINEDYPLVEVTSNARDLYFLLSSFSSDYIVYILTPLVGDSKAEKLKTILETKYSLNTNVSDVVYIRDIDLSQPITRLKFIYKKGYPEKNNITYEIAYRSLDVKTIYEIIQKANINKIKLIILPKNKKIKLSDLSFQNVFENI